MPANPADPGDDLIPGDPAHVEQDSSSSNKTGDKVNNGSENPRDSGLRDDEDGGGYPPPSEVQLLNSSLD